jgi:phosphatidylglycerophosphate synthase
MRHASVLSVLPKRHIHHHNRDACFLRLGTEPSFQDSVMAIGWSLSMHAVAMLTVLGAAAILGTSWPLAIGAGLSLLGVIVAARGRWGRFGQWSAANAVTALRLGLTLGVLALHGYLWHWLSVTVLVVAFALDAVDGALARQNATASELGATFDMEVDAILVMAVGFLIWQRNGTFLWALVPGVLRYVYVVCLDLFPAAVAPRRSQWARSAFVLSTLALLAGLGVRGPVGEILVGLGVFVSTASFGRSFVEAYPGLVSFWRQDRLLRLVYPSLFFVLAWTWLNLVVNVRFPASEPAGWYFLPALDVTVLLAAFALLGLVGARLPWPVRLLVVLGLVLVRALRIGDGVTGLYFGQDFNLYINVPLIPELVRYTHSTVAPAKFYAGAAGALLVVALFVFATDRALKYTAAFLRGRWRVVLFAALALPFAIASYFLDQDPRYNQRYAGAFGASVVPRLSREATFFVNVYDHRAAVARTISEMQERLRRASSRLERLHHANVYLFFVESYGATVMNRPFFAERAMPVLRDLEANLGESGFFMASGRLDSATYGGMSWLAHATLLTGVRTVNQLQYDVLGVSRPRTLARIMHDAGYRTLLVAPNTNRVSRGADFYDFDATYRNWDFDYAGPPFAWASMPDQYVVDFVRRHVVEETPGPLFSTFVLVSSHAPWSHVPTMVDDWSEVGNGAIYNRHPFRHAQTNWPDFSNASEPYVTSIAYDLRVLQRYLVDFIKDDSLVIILGDHQPVSELTENSSSWAVPVHVLSRDPALVEPFVTRGYARGMVPSDTTAPMESFLVGFLTDFSVGAS